MNEKKIKKRIGAIIQARMSSTRLPGKVLKELPYGSGITVLGQVIKRLKRSKRLNHIIVATTTGKEDDAIIDVCNKEKIGYFRGSKEDVLSRYYLAAKKSNLDIVVRITSDCPCIDSEVVDSIIDRCLKTKADYASNALKRTYPHGLDTEVLTFEALEKVYKNAKREDEREHVTLYIERNPDKYNVENVLAPSRLCAPDIRITIDTEEDYALLCVVFDYLYDKNEYFNAHNIVDLFQTKPWLKLMNKKIIQKKAFDILDDEFKEAITVLELQDLKRASNLIRGYSCK